MIRTSSDIDGYLVMLMTLQEYTNNVHMEVCLFQNKQSN